MAKTISRVEGENPELLAEPGPVRLRVPGALLFMADKLFVGYNDVRQKVVKRTTGKALGRQNFVSSTIRLIRLIWCAIRRPDVRCDLAVERPQPLLGKSASGLEPYM